MNKNYVNSLFYPHGKLWKNRIFAELSTYPQALPLLLLKSTTTLHISKGEIMKIIFEKKNLSQALNTVQKAAQNKISSNTNNGIYINAANGKIEFQANDYSIAIKAVCEGEVLEEGTVVILSNFLPEMIRCLPDEKITMEQKKDENMVVITCGNTISNKLNTKKAEDFPVISEIDHKNYFLIESDKLRTMTNMVQFAAETDKQKKPFFTGILFEVNDTSFAMAATNTHRLAAKTTILSTPSSEAGRMIVPSGIMSDIIKLLPVEENVNVEISWARSHIAFSFKDIYFVSTLINGEYPDYHRVIPNHFDSMVTVDCHAFTDAVNRATLLSRNINYNIIKFEFKKDEVKISAEDKDEGSIEERVPSVLSGDPLDIVFNCFYVADILKHSSGNNIILHLLKNGPMLVEQENDKDYQYVVTPMRGR